MATNTRTLTGTRSVLSVSIGGGATKTLGIFESIETGVSQDHFEPYVLGLAGPGEVVVMGQAPIMVRLSGFRKISGVGPNAGTNPDPQGGFDGSPYSDDTVGMNQLQDIYADSKELLVQVIDRQSGLTVLTVHNCKVVSHNLSIAAKQPARMSVELVGLVFEDAHGNQTNKSATQGVDY